MSRRGQGNERYVLTEHDLEFLRGDRELTERSEQNARTRIRTRMKCALEDLDVLSERMPTWNYRRLVGGMSSEESDPVYRGLTSSIGMFYGLAESSTVDPELLFTDGVRKGIPHFASVDGVEINVEYPQTFDPYDVKSKVESGDTPTPWEVGMLLLTGYDQLEVTYGEETKPIVEMVKEMHAARGEQLDALWTV